MRDSERKGVAWFGGLVQRTRGLDRSSSLQGVGALQRVDLQIGHVRLPKSAH
jgi:hypothetical protein